MQHTLVRLVLQAIHAVEALERFFVTWSPVIVRNSSVQRVGLVGTNGCKLSLTPFQARAGERNENFPAYASTWCP